MFEILHGFQRIREFCVVMSEEKLDKLMLTPPENRLFDAVFLQLKNINSVTKRLQDSSTTLSNVRDLCGLVIEEYNETTVRLSPTVYVMHNQAFESPVVKDQRGCSQTVTYRERNAIQCFEVQRSSIQSCGREILLYSQRSVSRLYECGTT